MPARVKPPLNVYLDEFASYQAWKDYMKNIAKFGVSTKELNWAMTSLTETLTAKPKRKVKNPGVMLPFQVRSED